MNVVVTVTLKNGVLDPQGKAVEHALHNLGYEGAQNIRIGKQIELTLPDNTSDDDLKEICEKLLANTVIEDYTIQK
jgi:phosphoribosylformylglycinamidine synthase subunit PurS